MFWIDLLLALIVGVVLTLVFVFVVRRRGPWESTLLFFILVFLGAWAGGLWLKPVGPPYNGFYFINYIVAGLILAVLIAAAGPASKKESRKKIELKTQDELMKEKNQREIKRIDLLLSVLIVFLLLIILLSYVIVL
jgi:hypothetical protein